MPAPLDLYDAVAYPSHPYPDTHPDHLAVIATLHGLTPPPIHHCRVLEVACNEGANLIPMACALPNSEFVGFDLAALPVQRAQQRIQDLGLTNIRIFQCDILNIGAGIGQFDYILAHGFYAWVPLPVRLHLLALCEQLLTPNGVAFVSYNALPGSHLRTLARDILQFKAHEHPDPIQGIADSLAFLQFIAHERPADDTYRRILEDQLQRIGKRAPQVTFHDELAGQYHPIHFHEFMQQAHEFGLEYLSESTLPPPNDPVYSADTQATLQDLAPNDIVRQEQILDFLRARTYRETLLCRAGLPLSRSFSAGSFRPLLIGSCVTSSPAAAPGAFTFTLPGGIRMESNHPAVVALLQTLEAAWPQCLPLSDLVQQLASTGFTLDDQAVTLLTRLTVAKMIEWRTLNPPLAPAISAQPMASALSRLQAAASLTVTTLLHTSWTFDDPLVRHFLQLLDGTRDRPALLLALQRAFPEKSPDELTSGIEATLTAFYRAGLLQA